MKEPTYTNALKESWKLAWQHKSLWSFGLFAMLLGQLGISELLFKVGMSSRTGEIGGLWKYGFAMLDPRNWAELFGQVTRTADSIMTFIWLVLMLAGLAAVVIFVSVVCQGAIIHAAAKYTKNPKALPCEATAWHVSVKHFWKLLSLNLLRKLVLFVTALAVAWGAVYAAVTPGVGSVVFIIVFGFAVLIGVILSILLAYASAYVLEEEYSFWESITAATHLLSEHWLVSIEVGIMLLFMNLVLLVLLFAGVVYLFFLPILIGVNLGPALGSAEIIRGGALFGYFLFGLYAVTLMSIFTVYINTAWTYLFMKMHKHGVTSRLRHYLKRK